MLQVHDKVHSSPHTTVWCSLHRLHRLSHPLHQQSCSWTYQTLLWSNFQLISGDVTDIKAFWMLRVFIQFPYVIVQVLCSTGSAAGLSLLLCQSRGKLGHLIRSKSRYHIIIKYTIRVLCEGQGRSEPYVSTEQSLPCSDLLSLCLPPS